MFRFRHRFFLSTWAWLLCALGLSCQWTGAQELAAPAQPHVLTLGVFAYRPDNVVKARFDALGDYLTTQLQGQVVKVVPMGDDELEQAVQQHRVDFVLTNPVHYVRLREHSRLSGALATLVTRQGNHGVHGIGGVVVRLADRTDLKQLSDLADKRIAIASQQALGTYMAPAIELMRANVDLNNINWLQTTQPVDQVIYAVLNRQADAGFVRTGVLEAMERDGLLRPGALTVINPVSHPGFEYRTSTRLYPEWPFLVVAGVDPAISQRVSAALMALRPDDPAALAAGVYGFTIPADYAAVEQAMRELRMAPTTPPQNWTGTTCGSATSCGCWACAHSLPWPCCWHWVCWCTASGCCRPRATSKPSASNCVKPHSG
jgi:ABC-type phosphate/phosphonate transport system substrate-binding protein